MFTLYHIVYVLSIYYKLSRMETKIDAIEKAILGKPTLSEEVAVNRQKIEDHARRIKELKNRRQS